MKTILPALIILLSINARSQDTLSTVKYNNGVSMYIIVADGDTVIHSYYANGQLEGIRSKSVISRKNNYTRYHSNGKMMWQLTLKNHQPIGNATYFDESGKKIAEFEWNDGRITDTLLLDRKVTFLLGQGTNYSVVHGGMEREDGGSNIRGGNGVHRYEDFYTVKHDTTEDQQVIYKEFLTDFNGYFMVCIEKGEFGIFPKVFDIKNVKTNMGAPPPAGGRSHHSSWSLKSPLDFTVQNYQFINLHYHSVGYAP